MNEDSHLESDYEDRYTIMADIRAEDDDSDICPSCNFLYEDCQCDESDESDESDEDSFSAAFGPRPY